MRSNGQGIGGVYVVITDSGGISRYTLTGSFGYYNFDNVVAGGTYTVEAASKRFTFTPQTLQINDNLSNLDFTALP
jgi:hypothetical protein